MINNRPATCSVIEQEADVAEISVSAEFDLNTTGY